MSTPATDTPCPRCGARFHCGTADTTPCACGSVALDKAALAALRAHYTGCLCTRCLRAIADGAPVQAAAGVTPPGR